jgi:hypothetical protein
MTDLRQPEDDQIYINEYTYRLLKTRVSRKQYVKLMTCAVESKCLVAFHKYALLGGYMFAYERLPREAFRAVRPLRAAQMWNGGRRYMYRECRNLYTRYIKPVYSQERIDNYKGLYEQLKFMVNCMRQLNHVSVDAVNHITRTYLVPALKAPSQQLVNIVYEAMDLSGGDDGDGNEIGA